MSTLTKPIELTQVEKIKKLDLTPKERCFFLLALNTGLRVSDLIRLKQSDFNNKTITIKMQKTKNTITIIVTDYIRKIITDFCGKELKKEYLFLGNKRSQLTRQGAAWLLDQISEKYKNTYCEDIELSCHALRKTIAITLYRNNNNDIALVKKLLGHKNISSTSHYISTCDEQFEKVMGGFAI